MCTQKMHSFNKDMYVNTASHLFFTHLCYFRQLRSTDLHITHTIYRKENTHRETDRKKQNTVTKHAVQYFVTYENFCLNMTFHTQTAVIILKFLVLFVFHLVQQHNYNELAGYIKRFPQRIYGFKRKTIMEFGPELPYSYLVLRHCGC